jgi:hypothetical protein
MNLKSIAAGLLSTLTIAVASAAPVITSTSMFTETVGPSSGFWIAQGQYVHLDSTYTSTGTIASASAQASYSLNPAIATPLAFYSGPIFAPRNFDVWYANTSRTAAWNLTLSDSSGSANAVIGGIADPEFVPLLLNLQVVANGTTPTLTWNLPDLSAFDVDRIRVRVFDPVTDVQLYASGNLFTNTTSFLMPAGFLQLGRNYEFRVLLEDLENGFLENRSNTFIQYSAVPEPAMAALLGLALLGCVATKRRRQG